MLSIGGSERGIPIIAISNVVQILCPSTGGSITLYLRSAIGMLLVAIPAEEVAQWNKIKDIKNKERI
ncbi:hypothetical protein LEP1GSC036_1866 [Leptospira weilii str. 2006001853]|uniref:Uncharacterized protein n=1 Tax=Leptospira weilii str. 2006001853 TaxID=1001589 RepID=A0A828YXB6_9LEPT|nr:hypothetical protein LEP1GSC036_1866 [Leptospira weilii str. 2006001853]